MPVKAEKKIEKQMKKHSYKNSHSARIMKYLRVRSYLYLWMPVFSKRES